MPIEVAIPPSRVPKPMGMRIDDGAILLRTATPTSIGSSMTTTGVLLTNALNTALARSVIRLAALGLVFQALASHNATGCSAPVVSRPLPKIMSEQIVMSASLPKPARNLAGASRSPASGSG